MTAEYPTVPLPDAPLGAPTASEAPPKRRTRWVWWLIGVVVLLAVLVVVADIGFRAYAQGQAEAEIQKQLPEAVDGDVDVEIGGFSFLAQLAAGIFDEVKVDAPSLTVDGVPVEAHVVATGVPTDFAKPVGDIQATLTLDQAAVNDVVQLPDGATLELGDGDVSYDGEASVFGLPIGFRVTGAVQAGGDTVTIEPTGIAVTQGSTSLDLSKLLPGVAKSPITVCVAQYLPQGASVDTLTVTPGTVTAELSAQQFVLGEESLRTLGTCG
ncbi:LmeA family phospholipid-binding protein [Herbiconiux sp. YIM B11900]|uniref:LmeA family phospholipid-binding protein n=1 Tax=Herbiconiux sp. YIM B11900 TaxID=3404131 RepID=UPI003F880152